MLSTMACPRSITGQRTAVELNLRVLGQCLPEGLKGRLVTAKAEELNLVCADAQDAFGAVAHDGQVVVSCDRWNSPDPEAWP